MKNNFRVMIRPNELSNHMVSVFKKFDSLSSAVRYVKNSYSSGLGSLTLHRGLFWNEDYKQLMVGRKLAAYESLAMIVIERTK